MRIDLFRPSVSPSLTLSSLLAVKAALARPLARVRAYHILRPTEPPRGPSIPFPFAPYPGGYCPPLG